MNIDNSLQKVQGSHQFHRYAQMVDGSQQDVTTSTQRHRHHDDDRLNLSDASKTAGTSKLDLNPEQSLSAEQHLSIQIFSQMFKRVTGQDLPMTAPADLSAQEGTVSAQLPQQSPVDQASTNAGSTYQQSASYFQAQMITFNAEGSISTQDGQSVKFSVSLSMSRLFYSEATLNQPQDNTNQEQPLQASFQGLAAELTTTTFSFSIDQGGSADQIGHQQTATPSGAADAANTATAATANPAGTANTSVANDTAANTGNTTVKAKKDDAGDDPIHNLMDQLHDMEESMFNIAKKLFKALRIWQQQQDGSQQLLALGDEKLGALFVGNHSKPLTPSSETSQANAPASTTNSQPASAPNQTPSLHLAA